MREWLSRLHLDLKDRKSPPLLGSMELEKTAQPRHEEKGLCGSGQKLRLLSASAGPGSLMAGFWLGLAGGKSW